MNIGIFSDTYFPQLNGVATSIRTLTHALREKGHTVYIFTPSDPRCEGQPEDEDIFRLPSIPVYFVRDYRAGYIFPPHILKKIKKLNQMCIRDRTQSGYILTIDRNALINAFLCQQIQNLSFMYLMIPERSHCHKQNQNTDYHQRLFIFIVIVCFFALLMVMMLVRLLLISLLSWSIAFLQLSSPPKIYSCKIACLIQALSYPDYFYQ